MTVELRLLGGVSLLADGRLVSGAAAQPRRLAVLSVLAQAWPAAVTRDRLVGLIWPEQDEASARRLLTQALYELRRELGDVTATSGRDLAIDADMIRVDLIELRHALDDGDIERAVGLYTGPFLDGFYLRGVDEFERWASAARDQVHTRFYAAVKSTVAKLCDEERLRDASTWAQRQVALAPFDAQAVLRAIDVAERCGDRATALQTADSYETRLRRELGAEPHPAVAERRSALRVVAPLPDAHVPRRAMAAAPPAIASPESLVPAPTPPTRPIRHRLAMLTTVAVGALLLGSAAAMRHGHRPAADRERLLTVSGFDAYGDSAASPLAKLLRSTLATTVDGSGDVRVSESEDVRGWAHLRGSVTVDGADVRLDAELVTAEGEVPLHVSESGSRDSVVALTERLSLALLPALYPELQQSHIVSFVQRVDEVPTARHFLDGELALHRGEFERAYQAFRAVTVSGESGEENTNAVSTANAAAVAYAWYRRAVAAEDAHRVGDADRSAAIADSLREALPSQERGRVHAYAVWRQGRTREADSLFRALIAVQPNDADLWYEFAEVAYHGGPLIGRSLDAARDGWRRAVALDTSNFPALMHLVRLEARDGDVATLRALEARAVRLRAAEPYLSEVRAIVDAAAANASGRPIDGKALGAMPDASAHFVHAIVAGFAERPNQAQEIAESLIDDSRPTATRAGGFVALANLAVARGQLERAGLMLDSLERYDASSAATWRAYFAALPFLPRGAMPSGTNAASARLASGSAAAPSGAPLYLELSVDAGASQIENGYTAALAGKTRPAGDMCGGLTGAHRDLCADLSLGLEAESLLARGREGDALRALESMNLRAPYQMAGRSVFFARSRERFLRAQLLARAGRLSEALEWYAASPHASRYDYVFLAPAYLDQARIIERQGDRARAREHYRRAAELWAECDPVLAPLLREARRGVERLSDGGGVF
jgi:DNA-binding SARP family transcriptional activator